MYQLMKSMNSGSFRTLLTPILSPKTQFKIMYVHPIPYSNSLTITNDFTVLYVHKVMLILLSNHCQDKLYLVFMK